MLVDSDWNAPILSIHNVFHIFPHILDGVDTKNPLHILRKIVDDLGYVLRIGNQFSKFIYNEILKYINRVNSGNDTILVRELALHIIPIRLG